jgi:hypothetical protein
MTNKYKTRGIVTFFLLLIVLASENCHANEDSKHLKAERELADNVLK